MADELTLRSRVTPELWRLAVEDLGAVLESDNRKVARRIRSVIPLSDRARLGLATVIFGGLLVYGLVIHMERWFPIFVGAVLVLVWLAYLPRVRRGAAAYVTNASRARAASMLQPFEPRTDAPLELEYVLDGATLVTRTPGLADRTATLRRGSRAIVTAHVAVVADAVVFFASPDERARFARHAAHACGLDVA